MKRLILLTILSVFILPILPLTLQAQQIVLVPVEGTWNDGGVTRILPDKQVSFNIRFINNSGFQIKGFTNAFHIWTTGGTSFSPFNGELVYPGFSDLFDLVFNAGVLGADGNGKDTLYIGGSVITGEGLQNGFNEIVLKLVTGNIQNGETLCIDSLSFPQNTWKWVSTQPYAEYTPSWNGPQCFLADCPACLGPIFTNCVDTITSTDCSTISYQFEADNSFSIPSTYAFSLENGPGTLDTATGEWTYNIPPAKSGTTENLTIRTYSFCTCWEEFCTVVLDYNSHMKGDLTSDCQIDISDLVLMVDFMFTGGPAPEPLSSADLNDDILVDISDLVTLVEFIFNGGSI